MFLGFITVPLYIYSMLSLMSTLENNTVKFSPESTPDNLRIEDTFCFSEDQGNVKEWANIEILTFYMNILVMIFNLIKARLSPDSKEEDEETDDK